jgi:hypothetical protein
LFIGFGWIREAGGRWKPPFSGANFSLFGGGYPQHPARLFPLCGSQKTVDTAES